MSLADSVSFTPLSDQVFQVRVEDWAMFITNAIMAPPALPLRCMAGPGYPLLWPLLRRGHTAAIPGAGASF
jgi:hypothetical protein